MTDNLPPRTSAATPAAGIAASVSNSTANGAPGTSTPTGVPYYENLRRQLRDLIQKKRLMDKSLAQLEDQIYRFEQSYLEETTAGNIIKGFDNYIKGSTSTTSGLGASFGMTGFSTGPGAGGGIGSSSTRRRGQVSELDRVFSRSSASFAHDSPTPSSAQTPPSHAATPSAQYNNLNGPPTGGPSSAAGSVKGGTGPSKNKKKSNKAKDKGQNQQDTDVDETADNSRPPIKRLKITYSRE